MSTLGFGRFALGAGVAAALLGGCGGSQPPLSPSPAGFHSNDHSRIPRSASSTASRAARETADIHMQASST